MSKTAIANLRKDLDKLLDRLAELQKKMGDGPLDENEGEEFDKKAEEANELQGRIDRMEQAEKMRRTPADPVLPKPKQPDDDDDDDQQTKLVGQLNVGEYFVRTKAFRDYLAYGMPKSGSQATAVKALGELISLTRDEVKSLPEIGPDVLLPMRDPDVVRVPEMDRLVIRDVLNVSRTTAPAVSYVVRTYTPASAPVPEAALKPEAGEQLGTALAPVRTIAVWIPVTEQMLEDFAALAGVINTDLLYDIRKTEEMQLVWGNGQDENLLGLLDPATAIPTIPTPAAGRTATNVIELARMGITDVILRGGAPNAIVVHPFDWEAIELTKGTDAHYIWTVETTRTIQGGLARRLWGTNVVESIAMAKPGVDPTPANRHLLIGDFMRGATLWDRRQASIQVGWINEQFIRNMRTIRAEERLALGTKRPHFFAHNTVDKITPAKTPS